MSLSMVDGALGCFFCERNGESCVWDLVLGDDGMMVHSTAGLIIKTDKYGKTIINMSLFGLS